MFKHVQRIGAAIALLTLSGMLPAAASEASFVGHVVHVSTNNLKVESDSNQTLSFMVVPHFDQVFGFDGKTTYQMEHIHQGMFVRVIYDQHFIGVRHADKIILINHHYAKITG